MILGAQFLPERCEEFLESVRTADEVGYARAWLVDGQMLWQDIYVYMTLGLEATQRIAFGAAVTNPFTRHFTVTASATATLGERYPGRMLLGLGRGDNAVRTLGLNPVKTKELYATVPRLRALMRGEEIDYDGTPIRIRWAQQDVPIMLAATGPKNLRAAGALADIVMIYVGVHPDAVRWGIEQVRAGAEEAGRNPDDVQIALLTAMWVGEDQEHAWEQCRWAPAACANHIADVIKRNPAHGMPEPMTRLVEARDEYDYYEGHLDSHAEHTSYLTGELTDDFTLAGTPEKIIARLRELEDLGVHEVSCAYLNGSIEQMRRVGREILPSLAEGAR
jgi:alkanesulfonate monooxygenase SsuD/methylene tetrahydromethanopterin reductase-like flavin-dependent oxidoreductase (luciferase family)